MRRLVWTGILILGLAAPVWGEESSSEVTLRNWHLGMQGVQTWRNSFDVFDRPELPPGSVEEYGHGLGLVFGYRFGDRFLMGLQVVVANHGLPGRTEKIYDFEALITGTVLFRQTSFWQPYLRGGFGLAGESLVFDSPGGDVTSFGQATIAGGGLQLRLSSRFSLDFEGVATFVNYVTTVDGTSDDRWPEDSWKVRESNWGVRIGAGVVWWF